MHQKLQNSKINLQHDKSYGCCYLIVTTLISPNQLFDPPYMLKEKDDYIRIYCWRKNYQLATYATVQGKYRIYVLKEEALTGKCKQSIRAYTK